ncbi:major facilitator superfamily domain-containing protein [Yarrowia lipolytica]|jgi:MFS family permease|uniref:YALI0F28193p n=2 Tax=Yarrowia lipolytica TaxID=4952 RepID=Q6C031_YARLI|nr:YALI0F28193p [Yarrowia lipolytica CLIB122]AOW07824.1 hypothetical protein YALI1_F35868g [Yarrowia lipolytica]KAB8280521.1 major facilitator superfamily domain-containing protein [Yarrowia lipolytica]KAE8169202.1 major facilitator superfamily domain-containing protein [Yarrowia lipolytica]KAJ8055131.1 major facilitator superfamily domain-containing protein [Yarrowia lipolytica]QNP99628.1 MFS transporter prlL [Yarrowia lipolytica]|eukprot:XP_505981.1 YALI0F28193p [Yarrowia lipolytica CLIB122]
MEKTDATHIESASIEEDFKNGTQITITDPEKASGELMATAEELYPSVDKKKLLRKMDFHIIPMLSLLYLLCFLDRGNIGNANIEGLSTDLNLTGEQYNMALTVFFFTYAPLEVPSNMLLKKFRPSIWLPSIMVAWGLVMTLMGIVQNYGGLLATRVLLGVFEAGLFPGVAYYLTTWYCRSELQFRQAMFFSAASVAGAFSGLLAFAISKMRGVAGLEGWRWIFILEGIATVVVGFIAYFTLYDYPETAKFLTEDERQYIMYRIKFDGQSSSSAVAQDDSMNSKYLWDAFKDIQTWLHLGLFWGIICPLYSISFFLPSIIKNLGYTSSKAQLLTIPIYIVAACWGVLQAWLSDRLQKRSIFVAFNLCCMMLGYILAISISAAAHPAATYVGCYLAAFGIYPAIPGIISWISNNVSGSYKRAVAMAVQIGIGNLLGAVSTNIYRVQDKPQYRLGHSVNLGFIVLGFVCLVSLRIFYTRQNTLKKERLASGYYDSMSEDEFAQLGDRSPYFEYKL